MTSLLYSIAAVIVSLLIARYNESKRLFWVLIVSFMVGAIGGAMYSDYKSNTEDKAKSMQKTSIQGSEQSNISVLYAEMLAPDTQTFKVNLVGKVEYACDNRLISRAPSKCSEDIRAQPLGFFDSS